MQQRRPRLGDIVDDYCPRERRITNHAIVAMIEDEVKQTRCTTCDAEHEYKQAKVPAPRRKKDDVVTAVAQDPLEPSAAVDESPAADEAPIAAAAIPDAEPDSEPLDSTEDTPALHEDDGPVHRRLIRATLPRPDGQAPERKLPEFTVHQPGSRGRDFDDNRGGHGRGRRGARGTGGQPGGQPPRFGGQRHGSPHGQRQNGNRSGTPSGQRGGRPQGQSRGPGRKRGR